MSVCDPSNLSWVLDFEATYHMTPNAYVLSFPQPHIGMSFVVVGNNYSLSISHQRFMCLFKSINSPIILSNKLCVLLLYKFFYSIHKFTFNTNFVCLLDSFSFVIKDK